MLEKLRNNPFGTSLLVLLLYLAWFLASPYVLGAFSSGEPPATQIEALVAELPNQIFLIAFLTAIVALLKWWQPVGFTRQEKKSLRFLWPPLLYTFLLFGMGIVFSMQSGAGFLGAANTGQLMLAILTAFMVGYTEELMFRGILFYGMVARFKAFWGTIISALIFGVFHFINLIGGQGFGMTVSQVVHAAADGFMYAALRLITGSLWPTMLLHGFWDLSVMSSQSAAAQSSAQAAQQLTEVQTGGISISPIQFLPGLLYGSFVLWRWYKRQQDIAAATENNES